MVLNLLTFFNDNGLVLTLFYTAIYILFTSLILFLVGKILKEPFGYFQALIVGVIIQLASVTLLYLSKFIITLLELESTSVFLKLILTINFLLSLSLYLVVPTFIIGIGWKRGFLICSVWWIISHIIVYSFISLIGI